MTADFRDQHPGQIRPSARLWFGVEAEGVNTGLHTAFIAGELNDQEIGYLKAARVEQWFFTESFDAWDWYLKVLTPHRPKLVTASVMEKDAVDFFLLRDRVLEGVRVIVRSFNAPWVIYLRQTDQVSVGVPYLMVTFEHKSGVVTEPSQYAEDQTWPPK